ncbi:hypothetical protein C5B96_01710 [Subtercola sp. Z020]|uniref:hypothetical protein n=1 Tax=Subtercola sp. Z020 TaxID=2080582 RepID=UPI000CE8F630|nr:hypothetical protein [Subtercola sp. Z020]PPF89200.1 hypothetical protein C5B96_01710 [Subtercola sp. Z020]
MKEGRTTGSSDRVTLEPGATEAEAEAWLRARGLPFFVRRRRRGALLVARTAPFVALLAAADLGRGMLDRTTFSLDADSPAAGLALLVLTGLALVVLVGAPAAAFLLSAEWIRTSPRAMTVSGLVLIAFYVAAAPWLAGHPFPEAATNGAYVALALLATWCGVGSLVSWSLRTAVRQLGAIGQLTSRALPLLMLVVVVSFFSRTLWEVANGMSPARLGGVVALFALLGLFFIVPVTRAETVGLENPGPPLSRREHANVTTVLVLAQGFQVAIFSVLVCAFLTVLGRVAFSDSLLDAWLGPDREPFAPAGIPLPLDAALVKTAALLSCVSSLNFLISATTGAAYRSAFYDPLFDDAGRALEVRARYFDSAPAESARPESARKMLAEGE